MPYARTRPLPILTEPVGASVSISSSRVGPSRAAISAAPPAPPAATAVEAAGGGGDAGARAVGSSGYVRSDTAGRQCVRRGTGT